MWPAPLRRCAAPGLCRSSSARARRCAVAPCLVYYATLTCACAVAPCRRAAVLDLLRCQGAHMRRCAAAPLPRAWTTMQLVAQASFRCYAAAPSATEQRSNGAELRCCGTDALARSNGARSRVAPLRHGAPARRFGAEQRSTEQRRGAAPLRPKRTEHGARSTERSIGVRSEAI